MRAAAIAVVCCLLGAASAGAARRPAIVNGTPAASGSWPWVAFLANVQANTACTATVIAPMVVLTAAHCAEDVTTGRPYPAAAFRIVTGSVDWTDTAARSVLGVAAVDVDPAFNPATFSDDVAVLVLTMPTSAPAVRLAGPADETLFAAGTPVTMAGWGYTYGGEQAPPTALQWGSSVIQQGGFCSDDEYIDGVPFDSSDAICALDTPSLATATCHGDSGGPLMASTGDGVAVEIGVTSRGDPSCNPDFPSVFTRADAFASWAASIVAANPPPVPIVTAPEIVTTTGGEAARVPASAESAAGQQPRRLPAPASGLYRAETTQRGGSVAIEVGAAVRVSVRFRLGCPRHPGLYAAIVTVAPSTASTTGWRFSERALDARGWRLAVTGTFRAPASIRGTLRVSAPGTSCTSGQVSWTARGPKGGQTSSASNIASSRASSSAKPNATTGGRR